jgi:hypothetical protein
LEHAFDKLTIQDDTVMDVARDIIDTDELPVSSAAVFSGSIGTWSLESPPTIG